MKKLFVILFQLFVIQQIAYSQRDMVYTSLDEIVSYDSVYALSLRHEGLKDFPSKILECKNLEKLDLSWNKMSTIPPTISQLKNLIELNLNHNRLDSLPKEIGELKNLKKLVLSRNRLLELPAEMGQLTNLQELIMISNGIIALPESFRNLDKTLKIFDLRANPQTYDQQMAIKEVLPTPEIKMTYVCNCQ